MQQKLLDQNPLQVYIDITEGLGRNCEIRK